MGLVAAILAFGYNYLPPHQKPENGPKKAHFENFHLPGASTTATRRIPKLIGVGLLERGWRPNKPIYIRF